MSVIVTDSGFAPDDFTGTFVPMGEDGVAVDVPSDADPDAVRALTRAQVVRIAFPSFADGRGFTLAAILRRAGFTGRLRAHGHVLADQYAMARRSGFDEVEIDDTLAARQPQDQWIARADWRAHAYQARMRG
ncbi:putative oxidoreductase [Loktanella sp. 3ANDIMAR09]|uniref:DUF934 domain-containing protein n=1 Tax=Loktanella sp. 3ANDIMAR09 TaxID=1225657 RepID=UPI0006FB0E7D|nr:DUF934 domain-containing protein [Loktanella sp. 3ANDIMAR09]KQI68958.1 putative oxidoreductase [Loktanella sp. 3ANDIMAR09]